jgi:hypothetical protein
MFRPLKEALRGRRFANDDKVMGTILTLLRPQLKTFFSYGMRMVVNRYTILFEKKGHYFER